MKSQLRGRNSTKKGHPQASNIQSLSDLRHTGKSSSVIFAKTKELYTSIGGRLKTWLVFVKSLPPFTLHFQSYADIWGWKKICSLFPAFVPSPHLCGYSSLHGLLLLKRKFPSAKAVLIAQTSCLGRTQSVIDLFSVLKPDS